MSRRIFSQPKLYFIIGMYGSIAKYHMLYLPQISCIVSSLYWKMPCDGYCSAWLFWLAGIQSPLPIYSAEDGYDTAWNKCSSQASGYGQIMQ